LDLLDSLGGPCGGRALRRQIWLLRAGAHVLHMHARAVAQAVHMYTCARDPQYRFPGTYLFCTERGSGECGGYGPAPAWPGPAARAASEAPPHACARCCSGPRRRPPRPIELYPVAARAWAPPAPGVLRAHSRARRAPSLSSVLWFRTSSRAALCCLALRLSCPAPSLLLRAMRPCCACPQRLATHAARTLLAATRPSARPAHG